MWKSLYDIKRSRYKEWKKGKVKKNVGRLSTETKVIIEISLPKEVTLKHIWNKNPSSPPTKTNKQKPNPEVQCQKQIIKS